MKKTVQLTIVVCSIFLLASVAVFGADQSSKAVNSDTSNAGKITPAVVAINNFMLAYQLAEYGKKK